MCAYSSRSMSHTNELSIVVYFNTVHYMRITTIHTFPSELCTIRDISNKNINTQGNAYTTGIRVCYFVCTVDVYTNVLSNNSYTHTKYVYILIYLHHAVRLYETNCEWSCLHYGYMYTFYTGLKYLTYMH